MGFGALILGCSMSEEEVGSRVERWRRLGCAVREVGVGCGGGEGGSWGGGGGGVGLGLRGGMGGGGPGGERVETWRRERKRKAGEDSRGHFGT